MSALFLLAILAAEPKAPEPIHLAGLGFTAVRISPDLAGSYSETFALRLNETKLVQVMTPRDAAAVLGAERQRQLLGCQDATQTSCLAELAGALGADGVVTGEVAQVGSVIQLTVKVLSARDAKVLFQALERFKTEDEVLAGLDRLAAVAAAQVVAVLRPAAIDAAPAGVAVAPPGVVAPPAGELTRPVPSRLPLAIAGVGGLLAGIGGVAWGLAGMDYSSLVNGDSELGNRAQAERRAESGRIKQAAGISLTTAGGAIVLGSMLWYLFQPGGAASVSLAPSADGVTAVVRGTF